MLPIVYASFMYVWAQSLYPYLRTLGKTENRPEAKVPFWGTGGGRDHNQNTEYKFNNAKYFIDLWKMSNYFQEKYPKKREICTNIPLKCESCKNIPHPNGHNFVRNCIFYFITDNGKKNDTRNTEQCFQWGSRHWQFQQPLMEGVQVCLRVFLQKNIEKGVQKWNKYVQKLVPIKHKLYWH